MNLHKLLKKYIDIIPYLFFGVCTTAVNIVSYWVCAHPLSVNTMISTIFAWVLAVCFAYITNRKWVFHSDVMGGSNIIKEAISFFGCRLATGVIDWACMFIFVELFDLNDMIIKIVANVIVIVLNYVASKLFVFKKK